MEFHEKGNEQGESGDDNALLSLLGGRQEDAAIHRVSGHADGVVSSVTGSQWIATDFALAVTKG